jgi:hypothetical protein
VSHGRKGRCKTIVKKKVSACSARSVSIRSKENSREWGGVKDKRGVRWMGWRYQGKGRFILEVLKA